jgi:ribosomal protein L29
MRLSCDRRNMLCSLYTELAIKMGKNNMEKIKNCKKYIAKLMTAVNDQNGKNNMLSS